MSPDPGQRAEARPALCGGARPWRDRRAPAPFSNMRGGGPKEAGLLAAPP